MLISENKKRIVTYGASSIKGGPSLRVDISNLKADVKDKDEMLRALSFETLKCIYNYAIIIDEFRRIVEAAKLDYMDVYMRSQMADVSVYCVENTIYSDMLKAVADKLVTERNEQDEEVFKAIYDETNIIIDRREELQKAKKKLAKDLKQGKNNLIQITTDRKETVVSYDLESLLYFNMIYEGCMPSQQIIERINTIFVSYSDNAELEKESDSNLLNVHLKVITDKGYIDVTNTRFYKDYSEAITSALVDYLRKRYNRDDIDSENYVQVIKDFLHREYTPNFMDLTPAKTDLDDMALRNHYFLASLGFNIKSNSLCSVMSPMEGIKFTNKAYYPDVELIIDVVKKTPIMSYTVKHQRPPTSFQLKREILPIMLANIPEIYANIINLYYEACFMRATSVTQAISYASFPWFADVLPWVPKDKATDKVSQETLLGEEKPEEDNLDNSSAIQAENVELKAMVESLKQRIAQAENRELQISKGYSHEAAGKDREIGRVTAEKDELKKKIKLQEELINRLLAPEEEVEEDTTVDVSALQTKRYLFVCFDTPVLRVLQNTFPNSFFCTTNTANLSKVSVDAVVYIIRNMDHSMYYKIEEDFAFNNIPRIYCNCRNITGIYRAMQDSTVS